METLNEVYKIKGEKMMIACESYIDAILSTNRDYKVINTALQALGQCCKDGAEEKAMVSFCLDYAGMILKQNETSDIEMMLLKNNDKLIKILSGFKYIRHNRIQDACAIIGLYAVQKYNGTKYISTDIYNGTESIKSFKRPMDAKKWLCCE